MVISGAVVELSFIFIKTTFSNVAIDSGKQIALRAKNTHLQPENKNLGHQNCFLGDRGIQIDRSLTKILDPQLKFWKSKKVEMVDLLTYMGFLVPFR